MEGLPVGASSRQRPRHPGVDRPEAEFAALRAGAVRVDFVQDGQQLGGRRVGCQTDAVGLQDEAGADGAQVLPTDARGERTAAGPLPDDGRGALVGDAHPGYRTAGFERSTGHGEDGVGHGGGVELDDPGSRRLGNNGSWCSWVTVASGRTMAARTLDVPTSTTKMESAGPLIAWWPPGPCAVGWCEARSCPRRWSEGGGETELPGVQDAGRVEGGLESLEDLESRSERTGEEARAVQPDAVVVADGGSMRECR